MQDLLKGIDLSTSSRRDFDLLLGRRRVHHRRLSERLVGSDEWQEFKTDYEGWSLAGGIVNVDNVCLEDAAFLTGSEAPFYGVSVRTFNEATKLWTIYWLDSVGAQLDFQVAGAICGTTGLFEIQLVQEIEAALAIEAEIACLLAERAQKAIAEIEI